MSFTEKRTENLTRFKSKITYIAKSKARRRTLFVNKAVNLYVLFRDGTSFFCCVATMAYEYDKTFRKVLDLNRNLKVTCFEHVNRIHGLPLRTSYYRWFQNKEVLRSCLSSWKLSWRSSLGWKTLEGEKPLMLMLMAITTCFVIGSALYRHCQVNCDTKHLNVTNVPFKIMNQSQT